MIKTESKTKKIYLAGPIFNCTDAECKDWREYVKNELKELDFFDPFVRDYRGDTSDYRAIVEEDKADISDSDILLANTWKLSVGTTMEIMYAWEIGKQVIVVCPDISNVSPWLIYHSDHVVNNIDAAVEIITAL